MMVSPELISASSAPSTRPLNICETRLTQLITTSLAPRRAQCQPRRIWIRSLSTLRERGSAGTAPAPCSGVFAEMAAERVRLLHQRLARDDLGDLPEVFLVLHVLRRLAFDDDDRADELMVCGAEFHVADHGREGLALLVLLDHVGRVERAGALDHAGPDGEAHVGVLG